MQNANTFALTLNQTLYVTIDVQVFPGLAMIMSWFGDLIFSFLPSQQSPLYRELQIQG